MEPIDRPPASLFGPASKVTKPANVDWSQLAAKFHYLIPVFEMYGCLQFDSVIFNKLDRMTDSELKEANDVYKSLLPFVYELDGWVDGIGITKSRAAALVYFTLYFFEIAKYHGLISDT